MGAASSLLKRTVSTRAKDSSLLYLTQEEVDEDEACLAAQRRSIQYCVDNLYYSAPVKIGAARSPPRPARTPRASR